MTRRGLLTLAAVPLCLAMAALAIYAMSSGSSAGASSASHAQSVPKPRGVHQPLAQAHGGRQSGEKGRTVGGKQAGGDEHRRSGQDVRIGSIEQEGISVDFTMTRVGDGRRNTTAFFEGDDVRFRFRLSDTAGDTPMTSVYPAAWLVERPAGSVTSQQLAAKKAEALVNASIFTPADLDLNVYYVLTLNSNATITVVDPLFGYGGTKLLALIQLKSPGADWVLSNDESTLYVALPESHEIAVIDTATWQTREYVPGGLRPDRVALQPDGHYLWVAGGGRGERADDSGVTVLAADSLKIAARIRTGRGRHDVAFSPDSRFACVTNSEAGTLTVVDVRTLTVRADVTTGKMPISIDFSKTGGVAYVSHTQDGTVAVVSPEQAKVVARIRAETGLGQIKFSPEGRYGFVVNPERDLVHIIDSASSRIVQTGSVEDGPNQIAFSDELAYLRHRGSEKILMIPLDAIGKEDQRVPMVEFPAGQSPAGQTSRPCRVTSMVQAPGASAMLVANPTDQAVYFYKEGMAAPMGTFNNYGREPLAVTVVDRSLRERSADGVYETVARLREPGSYDVVFFLDAPRLVHCFPIEVQAHPKLEAQRNEGKVDVTHQVDVSHLHVHQSSQIRFRVTDRVSGQPRSGLRGAMIQTYLVPNWHERYPAEEVAAGTYAIDFTPPSEGVYYVSLSIPSIGLHHNDGDLLIIRALPVPVDKEQAPRDE